MSENDTSSDETFEGKEKCERSENLLRPGQCNYFVARKNRYCKMTVRKGEKYCGEHQSPDSVNDGELVIRVPCPLDSKHSCYAHLLKKHLKKCNAGRVNLPDFVVKDVNRGINPGNSSLMKLTLSSVGSDTITNVIKKIKIADLHTNLLETALYVHSCIIYCSCRWDKGKNKDNSLVGNGNIVQDSVRKDNNYMPAWYGNIVKFTKI